MGERANPGPVAFIHIDCDLYSSTTHDLRRSLADRMVPGTIILFDEYFNYPNWEEHEFKAFQEFVTERNIAYRYLAFARQQVAVRIECVKVRADAGRAPFPAEVSMTPAAAQVHTRLRC